MLTSRLSALISSSCKANRAKTLPLLTLWSPPPSVSTMEDSYHRSRRPHPVPSHHTHQYTTSRQQPPFPTPHVDPYFRPRSGGGPPGFHGPPHDFPPGRQSGPHPSPHPFSSWPSTSFSGPPPPPGLQPPHHSPIPSPMNFAPPPPPPGDRWNVPPSHFVGGVQGAALESRSMSFPNPPPSAFDLNNQGNREPRPHYRSHSVPHFGGQHPSQHSLPNGPENSYMLRGVAQRDKYPFENGVITFRADGSHHIQGNHVLTDLAIHQQAKRMKTARQNMPKRRAPKRPLVEANKEVRVKDSTHLSVVCYNLLAQDLVDTNRHLYTHCPPEQLSWDFRKENLLKDLTLSSADILCLQEVQGDHYHRWYQPHLNKHGYTGLFKRRTGSKSDGCAVFYREDKLKLLEWKGLEYQRRVNVLNRDNVAVLAKFAVLENGVASDDGVFCIANTHLLFNPKAGEVKLAQASYLLAELHKMAAKPDSHDLLPVLVCGDFNSTPNSPLLKFLVEANLDYSNLSAMVIAGYFEGGSRKRVIPVPLLPTEMNIGLDCTYDVIMVDDAGDGTVAMDTGSNRPAGKHSHNGGKNTSQGAKVTQPSEFTDSEVDSESKATRTTRSIRGAKGKGRMAYGSVNLSDFPSLLGPATKRGRCEELSPVEDARVPSRGSSVGDSVLGDGEGTAGRETSDRSSGLGSQSRASCTEDSAGAESLESSMNSTVIKNTLRNSCGGRTDGAGDKSAERNNPVVRSSVLTHPFKLVPAYPISKNLPSTVTTYHQCAFETVDYIFFSPITCRTSGTKKNLTGFNLLKRKVLPSTHTLLDLGPQPHQFLSSDHLMLQATFQFSW